MAWRIEEHVVRGEIDNRTRGRITGRIWLLGRAEPIELELVGNAWRDVAGRRLQFLNPEPKPGAPPQLAPRQGGVIGDCTASRKVKVPEIPMEQIGEYYKARRKFPWHWGNSLYLEWFSLANGRVVVESASYQLTIDPEAAWEMSAEEEEAQRRANGQALENFMEQLGAAVPPEGAAAGSAAEAPAEGDGAPLTEEEAEKMQEDSDRLADRINARVEREGIEHYERILEEELERRRKERGEQPLTPEQEAQRAEWIEAMNRAAEEAMDNPDPELEKELQTVHPLSHRARELSLRLIKEPEERGWIPSDANREHPVVDLVSSVMSASAKFAGALDGYTWPPQVDICANTIVRLKRAGGYLADALAAAECCRQQNLVDAAWLTAAEREITEMSGECDALLAVLRAKLQRGFD